MLILKKTDSNLGLLLLNIKLYIFWWIFSKILWLNKKKKLKL